MYITLQGLCGGVPFFKSGFSIHRKGGIEIFSRCGSRKIIYKKIWLNDRHGIQASIESIIGYRKRNRRIKKNKENAQIAIRSRWFFTDQNADTKFVNYA